MAGKLLDFFINGRGWFRVTESQAAYLERDNGRPRAMSGPFPPYPNSKRDEK